VFVESPGDIRRAEAETVVGDAAGDTDRRMDIDLYLEMMMMMMMMGMR